MDRAEQRDERVDDNNVKDKRGRKKSKYSKINNNVRRSLIDMVYLKDYLLKDAALQLGINYSTAKTILRIFRLERRTEKKNAEEENSYKIYLSAKAEAESSTQDSGRNNTSNKLLRKKRKFSVLALERSVAFSFQPSEKKPEIYQASTKGTHSNSSMAEELLTPGAYTQTINKFANNLTTLNELAKLSCEVIKANQENLNNLLSMIIKINTNIALIISCPAADSIFKSTFGNNN